MIPVAKQPIASRNILAPEPARNSLAVLGSPRRFHDPGTQCCCSTPPRRKGVDRAVGKRSFGRYATASACTRSLHRHRRRRAYVRVRSSCPRAVLGGDRRSLLAGADDDRDGLETAHVPEAVEVLFPERASSGEGDSHLILATTRARPARVPCAQSRCCCTGCGSGDEAASSRGQVRRA